MAFIRRTGSERRTQIFPKKASQAFNVGDILTFSGGEVQPAVAADLRMAGVCLQKITSADADYATENPILVELIDTNAVYEVDVSTGSLTTESVGIQYDLDDADSINVNGTSHKQVTCVAFISATKGLFTINGAYQYVPSV